MAWRIGVAWVLLFAYSSGAFAAGPITYQGGAIMIEESDRESTSLGAHYTFTPRLALGYRTEWDRYNDALLSGVRATGLIKRWNGKAYQANVYASFDAGVATGVGANPVGARPFVGGVFMADWETRRWFLSYMAHAYDAGDVASNFAQMARIGVAPYVADAGALHTWLMVEIDHRPDNQDEIGVTPLVRFLKGDALLELGWSVTDDQPLANFMYRF
jgi:hypothetical protein